jgi:hypothetical protein
LEYQWIFAIVGLVHALSDGFGVHNRIRDIKQKVADPKERD